MVASITVLPQSFNKSCLCGYMLMELEVVDQLLKPKKVKSIVNGFLGILLPFKIEKSII